MKNGIIITLLSLIAVFQVAILAVLLIPYFQEPYDDESFKNMLQEYRETMSDFPAHPETNARQEIFEGQMGSYNKAMDLYSKYYKTGKDHSLPEVQAKLVEARDLFIQFKKDYPAYGNQKLIEIYINDLNKEIEQGH